MEGALNKLLIIIPAYNEAENIKNVIDNITSRHVEFDYLVVNDGSVDDTAKICRENDFNCLNLPINIGLSGAFQAGMKYALYHDYEYVIQFDGDGQHNPEYIRPMLDYAEKEKLDVVIGSRFINGSRELSFRMLGNSLIDFLIKITTGKTIKDSTSGMRLYNKKVVSYMAYQSNCGPEPDTIAFLIRCGVKVGEYPVKMNERMYGESYLTFTNGIKYMFHMLTSILIVQWFRKKV